MTFLTLFKLVTYLLIPLPLFNIIYATTSVTNLSIYNYIIKKTRATEKSHSLHRSTPTALLTSRDAKIWSLGLGTKHACAPEAASP